MSLVELEVFSHHFSVTVHSREIQTSLMRYISQNLTHGTWFMTKLNAVTNWYLKRSMLNAINTTVLDSI